MSVYYHSHLGKWTSGSQLALENGENVAKRGVRRRDRSKTITFRLKTKELRTWGKELEAHVYPSGGTGEVILKGIEGL